MTTPASKTVVPLTSLVGAPHPTVQAVHPVTGVVYPIYKAIQVLDANKNDITPAAYSYIKGNEIHGPFADPIVARDDCNYRLKTEIEHGISNP